MIVFDDVEEPEGPVPFGGSRLLVTEMAGDRQCVTEIDLRTRTRTELARTGRPNGLAVDRDGIVWVAESLKPALLSIDGTGKATEVANSWNGSPFRFPNDLCFGPDGCIYMTDSGIPIADWVIDGALRSDWKTVQIDGAVYRIDPRTAEVDQVASGIRFANGIAFDEEADFLFVAESITGNIFRYGWEDSKLIDREIFANVLTAEERDSDAVVAPDGMALGSDGSLFVAVYGAGRISIVDPDGDVSSSISTTGNSPTNIAFGLDEPAIYVTEVANGAIEKFDVATTGVRLLA